MAESPFAVRATAGTLRMADGVRISHAWTAEGVVAAPLVNGAQALHFSVALCLLNDTYREAAKLGVSLDGIEVVVDGDFDEEWVSQGITYTVSVDSPDAQAQVARLIEVVDRVAEIPKALRAGARVERT